MAVIASAASAAEPPLARGSGPLASPPPLSEAGTGGFAPTKIYQVLGGGLATPGSWPWAAFIEARFTTDSGSGVGRCTGSLIGERWVITAAHCVTQVEGPQAGAFPPDLTVAVGLGDNDRTSPSLETVGVQMIYVHPQWAPTASASNDLALLRLERPVGHQAIRIGRPDQAALWGAGAPAAMAGWGEMEGGVVSTALRAGSAPIVADATCASSHPDDGGTLYFQAAVNICAGSAAPRVQLCSGDSGGPLIVRDDAGRAVQVGVTSFGSRCDLPASTPSVFVRVAAYAAWIAQVLGADGIAPTRPPNAATGAARDVLSSSATIDGALDPGGLATVYRIEYGLTPAYGSVLSAYAGAGGATLPVTALIEGLKPGTIYHYRVVADSVAGRIPGADATFTTGPGAAGPRRCMGRMATIVGTSGADRLVGTARADVIVGLAGADVVIARGGNDIVCLGPGGDRANGGPGDDRIAGGAGRDLLLGGAGRDILLGQADADRLVGGRGADRVVGGPGVDRLLGGPGRDVLIGPTGRDRLDGGAGRDRCRGGIRLRCAA